MRKKRATETLDLFTDAIELRGSVKMIKKAIEKDQVGIENLETAAHFMSKSLSLIQVIEKQIPPSNLVFQQDKKNLEALRETVSTLMKQRMIEAIKKEEDSVI